MPSPGEQPPGVTIEWPVIKHTEDGQLAWRALLRELRMASGGQILEAKGLEEAIIYGQAGAPLVRVTADEISGQTTSRDFEVVGNVRVVSYRSAIITTEKVSWHQEEQLVKCPGQVTLKSKQAIVTAGNLDYFVDQDLVKCPEQVRIYTGDNMVIGRNLEYNIENGDFRLEDIQMVFHAEEAQEKLRDIRELQEP